MDAATGTDAAGPGTSPEWSWHVDVPLVGPVGWPPTGSLAFLAVMGVFFATGVLSGPVATALAVGHVLARDHDHRVLHEIGEGLQDA